MRLFIAIDINDDVRKAVAKLQQELKGRLKNQKGIKWVSPDVMHLTLKFLGEADEGKIDEINSALEIACADKKSFEFELSLVGTFGRPASVLWLGSDKQSEEILKLAADLENAFEAIGFEKETRPFSAHLTLARIHPHTYLRGSREIKNRAKTILSENLKFSRPGQIGVGVKDNIDRDLQKVLKDYPKMNPVRDKESEIPDGRQERPVSNGVKIPQISADSVCLYKSQLTPDGPVYTLLRKVELEKGATKA